ncbi:MAG TPA: HEXXH motif domain-containing protein [Pseudonocardiaceae bacterium]|nr:HEXXH motif domain-containing protein [Pseudonocardiaceae bacterium]
MPTDTLIADPAAVPDLTHHQLSWADFDEVARGGGSLSVMRQLRRAERSRRLLLLRALVDQTTKKPDVFGPLPPAETAWELLERVEHKAPEMLDLILAHPYTGTWAGYVTRLLSDQITGVQPLWMHVGHLHALAAAAGIRAGVEFEAQIPVWHGEAILPTLGLVRLHTDTAWSVAWVRAGHGVSVGDKKREVRLPGRYAEDTPGWWGVRGISAQAGRHTLAVRLDDVDPYRGLREPIAPERLTADQVAEWRMLLGDAWRLLVAHVPDLAAALAAGLDSVVPRPAVPFRSRSASTEEAFGSAVISQPVDPMSLAATLVHEFQHIRLGGVLHMTRLYDDDDSERCYTPWRDDPRPIAGVLQGTYAFYGMTMFWRALAAAMPGNRLALFEFAHRREQTRRTIEWLRHDPALTLAGHRFVGVVAAQLGQWQHDQVPADIAEAVATVIADHYAGWRIRHVRPNRDTVAELAAAWLAGRPPPLTGLDTDRPPTPVPDGGWATGRADLIRITSTSTTRASVRVPDVTAADLALVDGRLVDAVRAYRAELAAEPDRPASWIGLGLALSRLGTGPAAHSLLHNPELVRAVHRTVRTSTARPATPDDLAAWIGRFTH